MVVTPHRKKVAFIIALSACLVALAVLLNIGWIVLNWRTGILLFLGVLFFGAIIAGLVLNTFFLVREIRRNEQHDAFLNAVTHELKTPVASIRLYLETLQRREIAEARRREFYGIMLADSDRLLNTIEQVLRAGRSGPGRAAQSRTMIDVREMVIECVEVARQRHHLDETALRSGCGIEDGAHPMVLGDLDDLKAAVSNLIDNAIKYSGERIQVEVGVTRPGPKKIAIQVKDSGIGIPEEELKRIFKRFYRIPGTVGARVKGTGLGLYIVRSVAQRHGGKAFAYSEGMGRGSTFTLQLPCAQE